MRTDSAPHRQVWDGIISRAAWAAVLWWLTGAVGDTERSLSGVPRLVPIGVRSSPL